ncbi:MAG: dockerin type I repeat-containing protein [Bacteroidaceae bacterium]|nr:dockerin type I repeat-containing protein [Bacteroidaceae bacterium]
MKRFITFLSVMLCSLLSFAQFSGAGNGTAEDPYQITNAVELYQLRNNLTSSFILMNDLDLTDWLAENSPETGWGAVGTDAQPFQGVFDGNGKTIKYFINHSSKVYAGLFGYTSYATIKNLNVEGDVIASSGGGIIGNASRTVIINCTFRGNVQTAGYSGGIVGDGSYYTNIETCFVNGRISGITAGGIIGYIAQSDITKCGAKAEITNPTGNISSYLGGIAGRADYSSYITKCYFNGTVVSTEENRDGVGGIIGYTTNGKSSVGQCIVISPMLKGDKNVGGIVGGVGSKGCNYSSNVAIVDSLVYKTNNQVYRIGAYSGGNDGTSTENLALQSMVVYQIGKTQQDVVDEGGNNGMSLGKSMLKLSSTYSTHGFDMTEDWDIDDGNGYPYLRCAKVFMDGIQNEPVTPDNHEEDTDILSMDNALYLEKAEVFTGNMFEMPILLKNNVDVAGVSLTLELPEGMTLVKDKDGDLFYSLNDSRARSSKFSVYWAEDKDGSYGFRIMPTSTTMVSGVAGTIITLMVDVTEEMEAGEYQVVLKQNSLTVKDSEGVLSTLKLEDTRTTLMVLDVTPGDANGDGNVDLTDAIMIVYSSLGVVQPGLIEKAADVNGDSEIDLTDAIIVVYKSLGVNMNQVKARVVEPE